MTKISSKLLLKILYIISYKPDIVARHSDIFKKCLTEELKYCIFCIDQHKDVEEHFVTLDKNSKFVKDTSKLISDFRNKARQIILSQKEIDIILSDTNLPVHIKLAIAGNFKNNNNIARMCRYLSERQLTPSEIFYYTTEPYERDVPGIIQDSVYTNAQWFLRLLRKYVRIAIFDRIIEMHEDGFDISVLIEVMEENEDFQVALKYLSNFPDTMDSEDLAVLSKFPLLLKYINLRSSLFCTYKSEDDFIKLLFKLIEFDPLASLKYAKYFNEEHKDRLRDTIASSSDSISFIDNAFHRKIQEVHTAERKKLIQTFNREVQVRNLDIEPIE